jgi:hypothetical protein
MFVLRGLCDDAIGALFDAPVRRMAGPIHDEAGAQAIASSKRPSLAALM